MKEIILLRHGIAYDKGENGIDFDNERMLTPKGRGRTKRMCQLLSRMNYKPDCIYSSPLIRSVETATIATEVLKIPSKIMIVDFLSPSFKLIDAVEHVKKISFSSIILVGHMPSLAYIGTSLVSGTGSIDCICIKKSGACCISFEDTIFEGAGTLNWLVPPQMIKAIKS